MTVKRLSAKSSKAEELAMLEHMRAMAGKGSYLADVFTDSFMAYVKRAIQDDLSPDIVAELKAATSEKWEKADALLKAQADLTAARSTIAFYTGKVTETLRDLRDSNQRVGELDGVLAAIRHLTLA